MSTMLLQLSPSMVSCLFNKLTPKVYCPRNFHARHYLRQDCNIPSMPMLYGRYFEYLLLGGERALPPTKKNGTEKIDTIRVQEQAKIGKSMLPQKLISVYEGYNTQVKLYKKFGDVILYGVLDLFPTLFRIENDLRLAVIDTKLTSDINSTFGPYGWGDFQSMDWIQACFYHEIIRDIDWNLNQHIHPITKSLIEHFRWYLDNDEVKFFYWVFGIKEPLENKFFEVVWDYDKQKYLQNTVQMVKEEISFAEKMGWREVPGNHCKTCMLQCTSRQTIETL